MAFEVFSEISVRDDDTADISLIVGSDARRSLFEVQLVGRKLRSEVELYREFDLDGGPVTITLQGVFKRDGGTARAQVRVPSFGIIEGIRVSQASADYIEARVSHLDHESHDRTRRVKLSRISCRIAHFAEHGLIECTKRVQFVGRREMDIVHLINNVAQEIAALHPVIDALEYGRNHIAAIVAVGARERTQVSKFKRDMEGENATERARSTADLSLFVRQQEEERSAEEQRQRERGGRER